MKTPAQKWKKMGSIFNVNEDAEWMSSHASFPKALVYKDKIRVYFTTRDKNHRGRMAYFDTHIKDPTKVINVSKEPVLNLGEPGTFDDCGVTPSSALRIGNDVYMYYHGWNALTITPHRLTTGLAISMDDGNTFERYSRAPLFERTDKEPIFSNNPCVLKDGDQWHMWYMCLEKWIPLAGRYEGLFTLYYAHSKDGVNWQRDHVVAIPKKYDYECISNATVVKEDGIFKMWYSYRSVEDFRANADTAYRIGYAESTNAKDWERKDEELNLEQSPQENDWDKIMQAFPSVVSIDDKRFMFYNGNGFGKTGIGLAILEK